MTDLNTRLFTALGGDWPPGRSPWEGLIRLYDADPEAFYVLASDGVRSGVGSSFVPLAELAEQVRMMVRGGYRLVAPSEPSGPAVKDTKGNVLPVPPELFQAVRKFLLEIDGKGTSAQKGRDYEGRAITEAEVRFKLGEVGDENRHETGRQALREAKPLVFRVSPEDLQSLQSLPGYVTHGLLQCARKTVLAPTAVYRGLKRGNKAAQRLRQGWAMCGKPGRAYDNAGHPTSPPADMVYMVYADTEGYVFDWDWVQEDRHAPGHPQDADLRFDDPVHGTREMVLDLPERVDPGRFDRTRLACSPRGDCIFYYLDEQPSYSARINEDLTVFYSLEDREKITGFKIKNVQRILEEEQRLNLTDAPGLNVLILPILRKTLRDHEDVTIKLYELIIAAALVDVKIPLSRLVADDTKAHQATF